MASDNLPEDFDKVLDEIAGEGPSTSSDDFLQEYSKFYDDLEKQSAEGAETVAPISELMRKLEDAFFEVDIEWVEIEDRGVNEDASQRSPTHDESEKQDEGDPKTEDPQNQKVN